MNFNVLYGSVIFHRFHDFVSVPIWFGPNVENVRMLETPDCGPYDGLTNTDCVRSWQMKIPLMSQY